jgi:hypothetical protein
MMVPLFTNQRENIMKKLIVSAVAVAGLMGSIAFADSPVFTCPAPSTVHAVQDSANPNQYNYATVNLAGAGFYISMTTKSSPVAVTAFRSADLLHHTIFNSPFPTHCYYQLADGSIMGLHAMSAAGPEEVLTSDTAGAWANKGAYDHCVSSNVQDCGWHIKIVNPFTAKK